MSALLDRLARWVHDSETTALRKWADEHLAKRKRLRAKRAPRLTAARATKAQRRENLATTRAAVMLRSKGWCEACRSLPAVHLHHLHGGSGNRRKYEGPNACVLLCDICHHSVHQNNLACLLWLADLAPAIDAPYEVQASLSRRLDKARRMGAP